MGTEESGTAQCHLLLRSNMWSLDSHSSNTPGEQLRGDPNLPLIPSIQLIKTGWEPGGLGTHLHIRVRAATHDFPTYSEIQLLETEKKQV